MLWFLLFVIVAGFFFINAANFTPFIPAAVPTEGGAEDVWTQSLFSWATKSDDKRLKDAEADFRAVLSLAPDIVIARFNLACA